MIIFIRTKQSEGKIPIQTDAVTTKNLNEFFDRISNHIQDGIEIEMTPESPDETLIMMQCYVDLVENNDPVPKPLQKYVATAFQVILSAKSINRDLPAKAFSLRRARRGAPTKNVKRDKEIAQTVSALMSNGETLLSASLSVSEKYKIHESNIQKIYCKHQKEVRDELENLSPF